MTSAPWHRYVAIGDSFTEGMCDPLPEPPDGFRGWADRLAAHLSALAVDSLHDFAYANLAVRGRKLNDVVGPQLDSALTLQPDLVSIVGGGNDILRPSVDLEQVADRLDAAVARIRAMGADVLLATPSDPAKAGIFAALRPRHAAHTANLHSIAGRHGAAVVDVWGLKALQDWRMWADDRIHLTSEGHHRVACAAATALGIPLNNDDWREPLPAADRLGRREALTNHAAWARVHLGPWVQRRLHGRSSGDAISAKRPALAPIAPARLDSEAAARLPC